MYRRPVVDEAQGVSQVDFDRFGTYPQTGIALTTGDLLYSSLVYAGLLVSAVGDGVSVNIAQGRVYDSGSQSALEDVQTRSIASYVPTVAGRSVICLVVAQGQEVADDLENRYYERAVDPSNPNAGTQQSVEDGYRTKNRKVVVTVIPGTEAVRPVAPSAPVGSVAVAEITVTTSGIQSIAQRTDTQATRLDVVASGQKDLALSIALINQTIDGLRVDLASIRADLLASASASALASLQVDVALLKDANDLPDDGSPYWADRFLDYGESDWDPTTATGNVDFNALVEEGVRFAYDAESEFALSLYNPNDPNLSLASTGIICPKFAAVPGITLDAATDSSPLGGVTISTVSVEHLTASRTRTRYGDAMTICNNSQMWKSGKYDPIAGIFTASNGDTYAAAPLLATGTGGSVRHQLVRLQRIFTDEIEVPYDKYVENQTTISGVITAQSFLQHQERWVVGTDLAIKRWGDGAQVSAVFVECRDDGSPDPTRALGTVTLAAAQFKAWPEWTSFDLPKPVFTQPLADSSGRARAYAIMWFTTGDVDAMTADGQSFLGGTRFQSTDGVYFVGDITKDQCFRVRYANFSITNMPIRLGSWNLSGGIQNIDVLAPMIVPGAASAKYQVNVGGTWRSLDASESGASFLNGTQALYDAQLLVTGTEWAMPIVETGDSRVRLTRLKTNFDWISAAWHPGEVVTTLKVRGVFGAYDAARHAVTAKLRTGATFATSKAAVAAPTINVVPGREVARPDQESAVTIEWTFDFTGSPLAADAAVKMELVGTTNNYKVPFHAEWLVARKAA